MSPGAEHNPGDLGGATASGRRPAVVLLSGGLDSATVLAIARSQRFACHTLSIDYGQRHRVELERAARLAKELGAVEHRTVCIDLRAIGGSALTSDVPVPRQMCVGGIPITYVPARNSVFLSLALGYAEVLNARDLFIGVNAVDYSGYPDCRPEFIAAFEALARVATKAGVEGCRFHVHAPLMKLSKAEIIRTGLALGVNYAHTSSCYDPDPAGRACGTCESCRFRRAGFTQAGVPDPTIYRL